MLVRTSVLALDQAVRVMFDVGDGLELWLDDRRLGLREDDRDIRLALTGEGIPDDLTAVRVRGQIGSSTIDASFEPEPNLYFDHVWDGTTPGPSSPGAPATSLTTELEIGWEMAARFPRPGRTRWWRRQVSCGGVDLRGLGFGGITPTPIHLLDVNADILWRGDGSRLADAVKQNSRSLARLRIRDEELGVSDNEFAHVFDRDGNFRRTLSALTGSVLATAKTDDDGRVTSWVDVGNRYTIDRRNDSEALLRSPSGVWAVVDFDDSGLAVAVTDQTHTKVTLEWGETGGLSGVTDSAGLITKIERDERGRVVRFVDSTGRQLDLVRTDLEDGSQVTVVTAEGRETRHRTVQMPDGTTVDTHSCCGASNPRIVERRSLGPLGEERIVHSPDGTVATTRRSALADDERAIEVSRMSIKPPTGRAMSVERRTEYERGGATSQELTIGDSTWLKRLMPETHTTLNRSPEGREVTAKLDPGKSLTVTAPRSGSLAIEYDDQGRPKRRRHNGSELTFGYDHNGRLTWTDFERWRQQLHHDEPGRVDLIETPDGWLQFLRDDAGRVIAVKTATNAVTAIDRRPDGEIESITYPTLDGTGSIERFAYDLDGLLIGRSFDDDEITYERDAAGRVVTTSAHGVEIVASYDDASGQLTKLASDAGDAVRYLHDGDLQFAEVASGRVAGSAERRFDKDHLVVSRSVNRSHELEVRRDLDGLVTAVGPLTIEYNSGGSAVATRLGGVTTTREYDAEGRLSSHQTCFGKLATVYFSERIERDSLGRIIEIAEHAQNVDRVVTYDYNDQRRLVQVDVDGEPALRLSYDGNGNIVELERQGRMLQLRFDPGDRLMSVGRASTSHDSAGNLKDIGKDAALRGYRFDGLGRLVGFGDARGIKTTQVSDALGRPIEITTSEEQTDRFLWDGSRLAATLDDMGEVDMRFLDSGTRSTPDALVRDGCAYLLVTDHLGSIRCVINTRDGDVVQAIGYDALGHISHNTSPGWQPFGFAGGLHEQSSGLVRFRNRTYDPFIGRFLSRDPLGFAGGQLNLYQYAHGDPINYTDPSGLRSIATGELNVCTNPFIDSRPLTIDHIYLNTADWRKGVTPATSLGTLGRLWTDWTNEPEYDRQCRKVLNVDLACAEPGNRPGTYGIESDGCRDALWNPLDSCANPSAWEYDASSWSHDPGFLETVGRIMHLGATAKKWLPKIKPNLALLAESLPD